MKVKTSGFQNALFRKYGIVGFPHSFLGDYNRKHHAIEPCVILYFKSVESFTNGNTITGFSNSKQGVVRRINKEYGYVIIENSRNLTFQYHQILF